jgi:hypothetical protein
MGTHDSSQPPRTRRLVLRKIARPAAKPSVPLPPARVAPRPPATARRPPPPAATPATSSPPPRFAPPSFAGHAPPDTRSNFYRAAVASSPLDRHIAVSPARGSVPPVASTVPPGPPATSPRTSSRADRKWAPIIAAVGAGLASVAAVAAMAAGPRTALPGGGAAARAGSTPLANDGIELVLPYSSALNEPPRTTNAVEFVPEAPVEALPRAPPTTAKARGVGRRISPATLPTSSPDTHPLHDTTADTAAEGAGALAEPAPPAATTTAGTSDDDHNSGAPESTGRTLPAIDPLVKAIHDDIDEEEARRK